MEAGRINALAIHEVGSGPTRRIVVPGIAHASDDWQELAGALGETLLIVENPLHAGTIHWKEVSGHEGGWQAWWRELLLKALRASKLENVAAHSRGCADILALARALTLKRIALLAPPTAARFAAPEPQMPEQDERPMDLRFFDSRLRQLCAGMPPQTYERILRSHWERYGKRFKDILRWENPEKMKTSEEVARALVANARTSMLQIIAGKHDPWDDPKRRSEILRHTKNFTEAEVSSAHFPHVQAPENVAQAMREFS